ncbi:hypothetical protein WT56_11985 [Burkholderia pseudomultivorans]|uniref:Major facilitator superfamily (MFS) profile domain-containing protein n=1 Tax=Burkholderia pseudomultivorans TaxID=1207504 RepID=A0A132EI48_9BURK|nr:hypothetical protein WT56_11985 [Burkholderia pseudomultivorans]
MGSFLEFGTLTGYILGAGTVALLTASLSQEALLSWGWRVPFFIAGPIGFNVSVSLFGGTVADHRPGSREVAPRDITPLRQPAPGIAA